MLLSQILSAMLVKRGSAALTSIVITLVTPASTIAFTVPVFMGKHTEQMHPSTWSALGESASVWRTKNCTNSNRLTLFANLLLWL
jgi:hypothetical protein